MLLAIFGELGYFDVAFDETTALETHIEGTEGFLAGMGTIVGRCKG